MTDRILELTEQAKQDATLPTCSDLDDDCPDVVNKVRCYLYDPQRGMCPYIRALAAQEES